MLLGAAVERGRYYYIILSLLVLLLAYFLLANIYHHSANHYQEGRITGTFGCKAVQCVLFTHFVLTNLNLIAVWRSTKDVAITRANCLCRCRDAACCVLRDEYEVPVRTCQRKAGSSSSRKIF